MLREYGIEPKVFYNANAMVTTPYDIYENMQDEKNLNHGTVGVGFGKTIQRNEDHYHLYVRDLMFPVIRDRKLWQIGSEYYRIHNQPITSPPFRQSFDKKWMKLLMNFVLPVMTLLKGMKFSIRIQILLCY